MGFPNLCMLNGPQGAFCVNSVYQLDEAARHFAHVICRMARLGKTRFDVKADIEDGYIDEMWSQSRPSTGKRPACIPGYYNREGAVAPAGTRALAGMYPGGTRKMFKALDKERQDDTSMSAFDLA